MRATPSHRVPGTHLAAHHAALIVEMGLTETVDPSRLVRRRDATNQGAEDGGDHGRVDAQGGIVKRVSEGPSSPRSRPGLPDAARTSSPASSARSASTARNEKEEEHPVEFPPTTRGHAGADRRTEPDPRRRDPPGDQALARLSPTRPPAATSCRPWSRPQGLRHGRLDDQGMGILRPHQNRSAFKKEKLTALDNYLAPTSLEQPCAAQNSAR